MPELRILYPHTQSAAQVEATIRAHESPFAHRYGLKTRWDRGSLHVERAGMRAQIVISERQLRVEVYVPWLLRGFVPQIEEKVRRGLARYFC